MKPSLFACILISFFILTYSCKSRYQENPVNFEGGSREKAVMMDMQAPPPPAMESAPDQNTLPPEVQTPDTITRKIIRDGNMEVRVSDLEQGKATVDTLVKKFRAYYSNESFNNIEYSRGYTLTIRVPSASFDAFVGAVENGTGEVVYKNISSRDVTEEFIDLETRLRNKKSYLTRYGELLKQAKTVKDILEIQEKTRLIEEEVESTQGRLKYLNNQVNYSTLTLQISKKNDYSIYSNNNKGNFFDRLKMSLVKGWFGLVSFILFLIRIWPFWIILAALVYVIRRFWKRKK